MIEVSSYLAGQWVDPDSNAKPIHSAVTGEPVARAGNAQTRLSDALECARTKAAPALREMTFHQRATAIKTLATYLNEHKEALYRLSLHAGSTLRDAKVDIDGGIGTLFGFASKAKRELPDACVLAEGEVEQLSRNGSFVGQHVLTPRQGIAVQINAFNFPVWGMLEKLAPAILAGVPSLVKPATVTSYITEHCMRLIIESGALPLHTCQLLIGQCEFAPLLTSQDSISFTGSARTAISLRSHPIIAERGIRFNAEQDSLNAAVLGPDANAGSTEFDLLIKEIAHEITSKAGQKCTAIRRVLVPEALMDTVSDALNAKIAAIKVGDPADSDTDMGPLVSKTQQQDVLQTVEQLTQHTTMISDPGAQQKLGDSYANGAFVAPCLLACNNPFDATLVHQLEAFGPVATLMPYKTISDACALLNLGDGSLVASVFTQDKQVIKQVVTHSGAFHGRLYFNNAHSMNEATGHGAPLPHMVHSGPGRAGDGEELGGMRAVKFHMQRTAIQGHPDIVSAATGVFVPGSEQTALDSHPFTLRFGELITGNTLYTGSRTITLDDIEHFAHFTGDTFYAHMDEAAAKANPFFPGRVAHGYLLLSFAAGLFVQPDPGPVLANTGLSDLVFSKPVVPGDAINVALTVKSKKQRNPEYGEVLWHVEINNQDDERVASYTLHTMNAI